MNPGPKFSFFLNVTFLAVSVFGLYLVFSLFEIWAFLPFWVKNLALLGSLTAVYLYTRKGLKTFPNPGAKPSRVLGFLALVIFAGSIFGAIQAGSGLPGRLIQAFTVSLTQPPKEILVSISVMPPKHTNQAETSLVSFNDGPFSRADLNNPGPFPEGSIVSVEIKMEENVTPIVTLGKDWKRAALNQHNNYMAQQVLNESSVLSIQVGPYVSISQNFNVISDEAPSIAFAQSPDQTARGSLKIQADFEDDYGVEEIFLELSGGESDPTLFPLSYLNRGKGTKTGEFYLNLLADNRAGLQVKGRLIAVDGLGQKSESEPLLFNLPEKNFQDPLAREVAEIRKTLLFSPGRHQAQVAKIGALTETPERFEGQRGVYLALRSTYWRLRSAENQPDIDEVTRFLWQAALSLEDDGSSEEHALRSLLEEMVTEALANPDVRDLEQKAGRLRAKADNFFRTEFRQTRRRFSFNAGVEGFEIPQIGQFRELTRVLEREATVNNQQNVVEALLEARAIFEELGKLKGRLTRPRS